MTVKSSIDFVIFILYLFVFTLMCQSRGQRLMLFRTYCSSCMSVDKVISVPVGQGYESKMHKYKKGNMTIYPVKSMNLYISLKEM